MTDYTPTAQWILNQKATIVDCAPPGHTHYVATVGHVDYFKNESAALRAWKDVPGSLVGTIKSLTEEG